MLIGKFSEVFTQMVVQNHTDDLCISLNFVDVCGSIEWRRRKAGFGAASLFVGGGEGWHGG